MSLVSRITDAITAIGADIKAHATALTGKVNKTGDTVAGKLVVDRLSQKAAMYSTQTLEDVSGFVSLNIGSYSFFDITTSGNIGLGITNAPALTNETLKFTLRITTGGTVGVVDFFSTIVWLTADETVPISPAQDKILELEFTTNNGTLFYGRVTGQT